MVRSSLWADWPFFKNSEHLSVLDIIKSGTIDYKLAGLLWLVMEHRASVIVAAGPSWAGKTTLFHTMLDFLRPEIEHVTLRGYDEDFSWLGTSKPEKTYLITEEISNHQWEYLWGYQVPKAFELISSGYALGGTMHARNIKEVVYILNALGVSVPLIASLGLIVTLQVAARGRSYDDLIRYVDTVSILSQNEDGLVAQILAYRQSPDGDIVYVAEQLLHERLSEKLAIRYDDISSEIEHRAKYLRELQLKGPRSRQEVRKAVYAYYRSKPV